MQEDERVETQKAYAFEANKLSFVALWQVGRPLLTARSIECTSLRIVSSLLRIEI